MTEQLSPITPPPELVRQWTALANEEDGCKVWNAIATQAAQWGADQELEACCKELEYNFMPDSSSLRAARRPKPPTLKEQALRVLVENGTNLDGRMELDSADIETIRRALEALDD